MVQHTNKPRRREQHHNGLKSVLLVSGLAASMIGTHLIVIQEPQAQIVEIVATPQPTTSSPPFDPSLLQPISTAVQPQLAPPTLVPSVAPAQTTGGAGGQDGMQGNPPPSSQGDAIFTVPEVIDIGNLPALPSIPSSGGGGGSSHTS